jgi:hypothetical protein
VDDIFDVGMSRDMSRWHDALVSELYAPSTLTLDDLPYTAEFEQLYTEFVTRSERQLSRHEFWRAMANARKAGRLVRKAR